MKSESKPNMSFESVVIISLDCVRQEALGCYHQRFPWRARTLQEANTPNIDRLCAAGHRFDQAITHAPFTPAAHASLLTGLIPPKHGVRKFLGVKISESATTLAEALSAGGLRCGAVVAAFSLNGGFGFARGFDHYDDGDVGSDAQVWREKEHRDAAQITDRAIGWLHSVKPDERFFLFVHYFDAHNEPAPRHRPPGNHSQRQTTGLRTAVRDGLPGSVRSTLRPIDQTARSLYYKSRGLSQSITDSGLGYFEAGRRFSRQGRRYMLRQTTTIDAQIGRLLQTLENQGKMDETLVIVLADHGDDFWEHGEPTHRQFLYDTTLVVPLIIYPRLSERPVVEEQVRLVDIYPTILEALGLDSIADLDGENLAPLLAAQQQTGTEMPPRKAYSETLYEANVSDFAESDSVQTEVRTCYASLRALPWKLIWNRLDDTYELFNLASDPHETNNQASNYPQITSVLSAELRQLAQNLPVEAEPIDKEVVERLEALGYL